jgi:hypothetical protein
VVDPGEEVRFAPDSPLEGGGFEPPVPRQRRHPSATANHLASYHLPRKLGLRFVPKASTPSRKSSEPRRPVFKIELKPWRSAMTLSLPANRCTGHVILGLDRLTRHAAQMDREPELKIIRRAFAKEVMAACGIKNPRVEAAFAAVAREDFLGPRPWQIVRWDGGYRATPDPDPVYLYTDDVIGILPERNLNNGPLASCGVDRRRRATAGGACRRRRRPLHGHSRGAGRRHREGDGDRIRCRDRRPRDGEFGADAACPRGARRWHVNRVRTRRRHLCQCRRDAARGCMAGPAKGGGKLILPLTADRFPNRDVRRGVVFRIERRLFPNIFVVEG